MLLFSGRMGRWEWEEEEMVEVVGGGTVEASMVDSVKPQGRVNGAWAVVVSVLAQGTVFHLTD